MDFITEHKNILIHLFITGLFLIIYVLYLSVFPELHPDEGFIFDVGHDLATNGKFRTTGLKGYLETNKFTFWDPPLYMVLIAIFLRIFGISFVYARMVSVVFGVILGVLLLKERYGTMRLLGSILIFMGVYILGVLT